MKTLFRGVIVLKSRECGRDYRVHEYAKRLVAVRRGNADFMIPKTAKHVLRVTNTHALVATTFIYYNPNQFTHVLTAIIVTA